jgi:CheY-like chemotaxis protein
MQSARNILIIDDDEDDRSFFVDAIKEVNASSVCEQAHGGVEALEQLYAADVLPDLIFLDLNMPRLSGREFLMKIKQEPKFKNIPVVIYSTSKRKEDSDEAFRLGAVYFLTKPILFKEICDEITVLLNKKW